MKKCKITLSAELGEQSIETFLSDDAYRTIQSLERAFKLNRKTRHQPVLEVLTLQEDRPESGNLFDLRPNTP